MGSSQSMREADYQPAPPYPNTANVEATEDHHINISNKMVERLMEDAVLTDKSPTAVSAMKEDIEKMYIKKLKNLDDNHSEKCGLSVDEMNTTIDRLEKRTAHMEFGQPVCEEYKKKMLECYEYRPDDAVACWNTVEDFSKCVQNAGNQLLRARTEHEAFEKEKRERRVARARQNALKDLGVPINAQ